MFLPSDIVSFRELFIAEYKCNHQPACGIADLFQGLADGFAKTG